MYLKKHSRFKDGKDHVYWSLMETVRTANGPRQRLLCYLGEINNSQEKTWRKAIRVFNDNGQEEQLSLFPSASTLDDAADNIVKIDLKMVRLERAREFGAIYTALELCYSLAGEK